MVVGGDYVDDIKDVGFLLRAPWRYIGIFMHVKLAKDYSLLISSHKVGKIVHAFSGGRTMDPELWPCSRSLCLSPLLCIRFYNNGRY